MNQAAQPQDSEVMDYAMSAYLSDFIAAKNRSNRVKINMECRRKLEIKSEERRLIHATSEFDFG